MTAQAQIGGVPLWTNTYNGSANGADQARAMAVDGSSNVFVTGSSTGAVSGLDYATIKYSATGVPLWTNRYNGPASGDDSATAMAADSSGNVFVAGSSAGSGSGLDYVTIKYSGVGVALWTNVYNGTGNGDDEARGVAVNGGGNVFLTGRLVGTNVGARGPGIAIAVAVDPGGNVLVTGDSHFHLGDSIYETKKFSGSGVALWTTYYYLPSPSNADYPTAIAVDANGNVFVTGRSGNFGGPSDYATVAYSGGGVRLWVNRYDEPGNTDDHPTALAVDGSGNVFVTGYSTGIGSGYDYATIKYSLIPPSLTVARTTTNTVALSWPSPSTGFTLQQNTNGIATVNWSNVVTAPSDDGTTKTVIVNPPTGNRFYRLLQP